MVAFVVGTAAAFAWSLVTNFLWVWEQHNLPKTRRLMHSHSHSPQHESSARRE